MYVHIDKAYQQLCNWFGDIYILNMSKDKKNRQESISIIYKTASFQKEAMRTQVALYFFMKWNLYRVVSLCSNKQNVQNRQVAKVYCFKRLW